MPSIFWTIALVGVYILTICINLIGSFISFISTLNNRAGMGIEINDSDTAGFNTFFQWFGSLTIFIVWLGLTYVNGIGLTLYCLLVRYALTAVLAALFSDLPLKQGINRCSCLDAILGILIYVELLGHYHPLEPSLKLVGLTLLMGFLSTVVASIAFIFGGLGMFQTATQQLKPLHDEFKAKQFKGDGFSAAFQAIVVVTGSLYRSTLGLAIVITLMIGLLQARLLQVPFNSILWLYINFNLYMFMALLVYQTTRSLTDRFSQPLSKLTSSGLALSGLGLGIVLSR